MKKAPVLFWQECERRGYKVNVDWAPLLHVHDEVQIECRPEIADELGALLAECIAEAGRFFKFRCPLAGSWAKGDSWLACH